MPPSKMICNDLLVAEDNTKSVERTVLVACRNRNKSSLNALWRPPRTCRMIFSRSSKSSCKENQPTPDVAMKWLEMGEMREHQQMQHDSLASSFISNSQHVQDEKVDSSAGDQRVRQCHPNGLKSASSIRKNNVNKHPKQKRSKPKQSLSKAAAAALASDTNVSFRGLNLSSSSWSSVQRCWRSRMVVLRQNTTVVRRKYQNDPETDIAASHPGATSAEPTMARNKHDYGRHLSPLHNTIPKNGTTMASEEACMWQTAVDPKSGRTYYYHIETRETQWRKPVELATPEERQATEQKDHQQRDFFAAMEANILKHISQGAFVPEKEQEKKQPQDISLAGNESPYDRFSQNFSRMSRPDLVRTISSMEDSLLISLIQRVPSHRSIRSGNGDQKEIVFHPPADEGNISRSLPYSSQPRRIQRDASISLLEATGQDDTHSQLDSMGMSQRSSLISISEDVQASPGSLMQGLSLKSHSLSDSEDFKGCWEDSVTSHTEDPRKLTIMSGNSSGRSLFGSAMLDVSALDFGLTDEETVALEELAKVTDEMASLQDDIDDDATLQTWSTGHLNYLTNIEEDGDQEESDEDESYEEEEIVHIEEQEELELDRVAARVEEERTRQLRQERQQREQQQQQEQNSREVEHSAQHPHHRDIHTTSSYPKHREIPVSYSLFMSEQSKNEITVDQRGKITLEQRSAVLPIEGPPPLSSGNKAAFQGGFKPPLPLVPKSKESTNAIKVQSDMPDLSPFTDDDQGNMTEHQEYTSEPQEITLPAQQPQEYASQQQQQYTPQQPQDYSLQQKQEYTTQKPQEYAAQQLQEYPAQQPLEFSAQQPQEFEVQQPRTTESQTEEEKDPSAPHTKPLKSSSKKKVSGNKPSITRRNTCGTLYVGSTMSTPDIDATLKCVCGVFRAHVLQSETLEMDEGSQLPEYRTFNDQETQQKSTQRQYRPHVDFVVKPPPPSLEDITTFYRDVFRRAKMEPDCIIMSLIYVERLVKVTQGALRPRTCNWRSILFSCMVLSSKVWDDLSMWNADFSQTCPAGVHFSLQRINELEIAILTVLQYRVKVPAGEYAKYYFLLRSMLIKSGLASADLKASNPLDVEGAKRLQHLSSVYENTAGSRANQVPGSSSNFMRSASTSVLAAGGPSDKVGLEHIVQM